MRQMQMTCTAPTRGSCAFAQTGRFYAASFFCQLGMGWPEGVDIGRLDMVRQLLMGLALGVGVIRASLLGMSTESEVGACDRC